VLHLFLGPGVRGVLEIRIVAEDVAEIGRVVAAVVLDHAGGFDDLHQLGVDLGGIELVPGNVV